MTLAAAYARALGSGHFVPELSCLFWVPSIRVGAGQVLVSATMSVCERPYC